MLDNNKSTNRKNNDAINAITKTLSDAYKVSRLVAQVILLISCLTCLTNCAGFVLAMESLSCKKKMLIYIFFISKSKLIIVLFINFSWQEWRDSNPQPPVLETGALPIELHSYMTKQF